MSAYYNHKQTAAGIGLQDTLLTSEGRRAGKMNKLIIADPEPNPQTLCLEQRLDMWVLRKLLTTLKTHWSQANTVPSNHLQMPGSMAPHWKKKKKRREWKVCLECILNLLNTIHIVKISHSSKHMHRPPSQTNKSQHNRKLSTQRCGHLTVLEDGKPQENILHPLLL